MQADGSSKGNMEIALDPLQNRSGDVWHASVASLRDVASLCYGWRADADISWDAGNRFHPGGSLMSAELSNSTSWSAMQAEGRLQTCKSYCRYWCCQCSRLVGHHEKSSLQVAAMGYSWDTHMRKALILHPP